MSEPDLVGICLISDSRWRSATVGKELVVRVVRCFKGRSVTHTVSISYLTKKVTIAVGTESRVFREAMSISESEMHASTWRVQWLGDDGRWIKNNDGQQISDSLPSLWG